MCKVCGEFRITSQNLLSFKLFGWIYISLLPFWMTRQLKIPSWNIWCKPQHSSNRHSKHYLQTGMRSQCMFASSFLPTVRFSWVHVVIMQLIYMHPKEICTLLSEHCRWKNGGNRRLSVGDTCLWVNITAYQRSKMPSLTKKGDRVYRVGTWTHIR